MKRLIPLLLVRSARRGRRADRRRAPPTTTTTTTTGATAFKVGLDDRHRRAERPQLQPPRLRRAAARAGAARRPDPRRPAASSSDYIPNLTALAQQGYNLVIGVGFTEIDAMKAVAKQFPKTHFAIVDVSNADEGSAEERRGAPLQGAGGRLPRRLRRRARREGPRRQGRLVRRRPEAAAGRPLHRRLPGRREGRVPGREDDERLLAGLRRTRRSARRSRSTRSPPGSVVVFQVAGGCGLGALDAAKEKGVWGVGVDADQGYLGPYVLTSALKRVDTAVYDSIKDAKDGKFKGGQDAVYGLDIDGVGIGKFSPKAPKGSRPRSSRSSSRSRPGRSRTSRRSVK